MARNEKNIPSVTEKVQKYGTYGNAGVENIDYGQRISTAIFITFLSPL